MQYENLGDSGLRVSRICLGMMTYGDGRTWHLDEREAEPLVRAAVDAGVTFFDTADVYQDGESERVTGRLLSRMLDREAVVVSTKVFMPTGPGENDRGLGRKHIMASIDASLRRLGLDYVDLYQIHRWDGRTPIEETVEALADVVRAGKARYLGASTMWAWQFIKAQAAARRVGTRFISMQNHWNLLYREEEREMVPACADLGVGLIPYSPLARGILAGNRGPEGERRSDRAGSDPLADRLASESDFAVVDRVQAIARAREVPPAQVALAWLLARPGVCAPIVGATRSRHIADAVAAVSLTLDEAELRALEEPYVPHAVFGPR